MLIPNIATEKENVNGIVIVNAIETEIAIVTETGIENETVSETAIASDVSPDHTAAIAAIATSER